MSHKTLIGGIAHKIRSGKTRVGGTVYNVMLGKTLVDGTNHTIPIGATMTVDLVNENNLGQYVAYISSPTEIKDSGEYIIPIGTVLTCNARANSTVQTQSVTCEIIVNGEVVASATATAMSGNYDEKNISYNYTVTRDVTIKLERIWVSGTIWKTYYGIVTITEH